MITEKSTERSSDEAAASLIERHTTHLRDSAMLRGRLKDMLLTPEGKRRPKVTLSDVARTAGADRIALRADELPVTHPHQPEGDMTDEELFAKIQEMLDRHPVKSVQ